MRKPAKKQAVPQGDHRDFVSFSRKKTALIVSYEENGEAGDIS